MILKLETESPLILEEVWLFVVGSAVADFAEVEAGAVCNEYYDTHVKCNWRGLLNLSGICRWRAAFWQGHSPRPERSGCRRALARL